MSKQEELTYEFYHLLEDQFMKTDVLSKYKGKDKPYAKAWRHLCNAVNEIGWKSFYYVVLDFQETGNDTRSYRFRRNPNAH